MDAVANDDEHDPELTLDEQDEGDERTFADDYEEPGVYDERGPEPDSDETLGARVGYSLGMYGEG